MIPLCKTSLGGKEKMDGSIFFMLLLNTAISAWNAFACGSYLTESKLIGGWIRFLVWCGLVMSACGFTWVIAILMSFVGVSMEYLTREQGQLLIEATYLFILIPILGSGLGIWVHSIAQAYRTRKFGDIAVAAWNTYAQGSNMYHAAKDAPGAFSHVWDRLSDSFDSDDAGKVYMGAAFIMLVIIAAAAGVMLTAAIARWADRRIAIEVSGTQPA